MKPVLLLLLILSLCGPAARAGAADEPDPLEPPVANRPANFSGAVGSFAVATRAAPTTLQAEAPLVFTVRISGPRSLAQVRRPDLRQLPSFSKRFHVENLGERDLPAAKAREFDYRLRPRGADVKQIPALPFVFFKPGFVPDYLGYQTRYAPAIPLVVTPRAVVQPSEVHGTVPLTGIPDSLYAYSAGPAVLRQTAPLALPGLPALAALLAVPPVLCAAWYTAWKRRHPDAARLVRQRRSRAARLALKALDGLDRLPPGQQAPRTEQVLIEYLRRRFDFGVEEPTPVEVADHLRRTGATPALAQEASRFFDACAAARFGPGPHTDPDNWSAEAARLVRTLEDQPWSSPNY